MSGGSSRSGRTIAQSTALLAGTLVLLTALSIATFVVVAESRSAHAELRAHGEHVAAMLAQNAEFALYTSDPASLETLVSSIRHDPAIEYIALLDSRGRTLAASTRQASVRIPGRPVRGLPSPEAGTLIENVPPDPGGAGFLDFVVPVVSDTSKAMPEALGGKRQAELLGFVQIGVGKAELRDRLRAFVVSVAGLTLALAGIGTFLAMLLARRIARPLDQLRSVAREIGLGSLEVAVPLGGTAEIDELANALDQMRQDLRGSREELTRRAGELQGANAQLRREVEERRRAEVALRESQERYALAARAANDGLWDWNLATDQVYYSPRWKSMLGLRESEVGSGLGEWFSRIHVEDQARVRAELEAHVAGAHDGFETVFRMRHPDGAPRWMLCRGLAMRGENGEAVRVAGSLSDITARKQAEERLVHDALHDALTGLPNRALFMDRLTQAVHRNERGGKRPFAVLYLDLDRFKLVNDSLGHLIGDQLLVEVSHRLQASVRPADTAARLGGDEFAVLLEDLGPADVEVAARRVESALARPFVSDGQQLYTSASIGVCLSEIGAPPEQYLRNADIAMYGAKRSGRGVEVFDASMHEATAERLSLETDLRAAVERREFVIHYQPIVRVEDARLEGFEALLRWDHPRRGRVSPAEFIPLLEETRLIVQVGAWVVAEACRQLRDWQRAHSGAASCFVSVNLSSVQLSHAGLSNEVRRSLSETELAPACLALEITESTIMENPEAAALVLEGLHALGVRVYLDDFGTGYSSLAYLPRFPIDHLKVDASFVRRMMDHERDMEVVRAIATVAQSLGMRLVAEGVEEPPQLARLRELGCDSAQGFLFSPAVDASAAEGLLSTALGTGSLPQRVADEPA